jgi:hypothetical protein
MKNKTIIILCFFVILLSSAFAPVPNKINQSTDWKLEKTGEGISIYTREYAGSELKEFKAITVLNTDLALLETTIDNVEDYPSWQANIATAKILKQINKAEQIIYYTSDLPWPISDRDIIIYSKKTVKTDGTILFTLTGKPEYVTEKEGYLRMKIANGSWQLKPLGKSKIELTYLFYGDPAGSIPNSVINMFIVDGPYTTFSNLKKKVEK